MTKLFTGEGINGTINSQVCANLAFKLGQALALCIGAGAGAGKKVIIGTDTRISGDMLKSALAAGLCCYGANVINLGIVSSAAVAHLVVKYKADAGISVSDSSHTAEYNGIRFYGADGKRLSPEAESVIEEYVSGERTLPPFADGKSTGRLNNCHTALRDYVDYAKKTVNVNLSGKKIGIDCAYGAGYECIKLIFKELGADVETINNFPNGTNINENCGYYHPGALQSFVPSHKCDFGFAFDGDVSHVLGVDETGAILAGEQIEELCRCCSCSSENCCRGGFDGSDAVLTALCLMKYMIENGKKMSELI